MESRRPSAAEASITSLSIFVGVSLAVIGFLLTRPSVSFGYNATTVACAFQAIAVALFLMSIEFFILGIHRAEHHDYFVPVASAVYGCGVGFMVVGVSLALKALGMNAVAYLFLSLTLLFLCLYYAIRIRQLGWEDPRILRRIARIACLGILIVGYVFLATVATDC